MLVVPKRSARHDEKEVSSDGPALRNILCSRVGRIADDGSTLPVFAMRKDVGLPSWRASNNERYTSRYINDMPSCLKERAAFEGGSNYGIYAVLVEGDDTNEPISVTVRGYHWTDI